MDKIGQFINKRLPAGSFGRNVITLMTGTTFAQALLILVAPVLTRLYSPGDFGIYTLYTSVLSVLAVVACCRYELAIVLPEKDEDAANVLVLSILICFIMAILILLLVAFFRTQLANFLDAPELAIWLWFMPLSLIAVGWFQAFNYWSTRRKQFKRLAVRQITQNTVTAATQIGTGIVCNHGPMGLICGDILGRMVATARLGIKIWIDEGKEITKAISVDNLKTQLLEYKQFPIFSTWATLLNTIANMLPALMLGYFFNTSVVGFYALGHRLLALPINLIGTSIAQVFFPKATELYRKDNVTDYSLKMYSSLLYIGIIPILFLMVVAPELFSLIFGSRWLVAGEYARWLGIWLIFQLSSSPISMLYYVLGKQCLYLIFSLILLVMRLIALFAGGLTNSPLYTIMLLGLIGAVVYFINAIFLLNTAGNNLIKILTTTVKPFILVFPFLVPTICFKWLVPESLWSIPICAISGLACVIILGLKQKRMPCNGRGEIC